MGRSLVLQAEGVWRLSNKGEEDPKTSNNNEGSRIRKPGYLGDQTNLNFQNSCRK